MDSEKNSKNYPGCECSSKNLAFSGGNIEGDTHLDDAKTSFCFLQPYLLYKLPRHRLLSHLACTSGQEQFSMNACQRRPHSHIALPHAAQRMFLYTSALSLLRSKVSHVSALSLSPWTITSCAFDHAHHILPLGHSQHTQTYTPKAISIPVTHPHTLDCAHHTQTLGCFCCHTQYKPLRSI